MINKSDEAVHCFTEGFNCAQSVFSTYAPLLGLDGTDALRVATGFGSGMARLQQVCGVVTGSFMLIGLKHGRIRKDDDATTEEAYRLMQDFVARFKSLHGSIICRDLIGCDLSTSEGIAYAKANNLTAVKCTKYVKDAATIVEDLLFRSE